MDPSIVSITLLMAGLTCLGATLVLSNTAKANSKRLIRAMGITAAALGVLSLVAFVLHRI